MRFVTLDFETYYTQDYSLSKMTTEEYVRDPRFEAILMGYKIDDDPHEHHVVGYASIRTILDALDIENCAVLAHHAHFDGLILNHHFGHKPKVWFDTLSMGRALHDLQVGGSLSKLMKHYGVGEKGTEVINAKGKRLADFTDVELRQYGLYCRNDVRGTKEIFNRMVPHFQRSELRQIDMVIRMFTEPIMELDLDLLQTYEEQLRADKMTLLFQAGVTLDEVMSNEKFAAALQRLGVEPPKKISLRTGKPTWAFSKTDKEFKELEEHPDDRVQTLVAARLGNKTTINETRARRMQDMIQRGPACMYYKYAGAWQTMRLSGGDKMNWQNLQRKGTLRKAIYAPEGYLCVVVDSSNIEARVLDWLACQDDMLHVYREADAGRGPDVYCVIASGLYGREITEADVNERQHGKVNKLACGYQMGAERYVEAALMLSGGKLKVTLPQAVKDVQAYRTRHPMVVQLWHRGQSALPTIAGGVADEQQYLDPRGLLAVEKNAIRLPNGLALKYPQLAYDSGSNSWAFSGRDGRTYLYGGKVVENVIQALAKIVVMDQLTEVNYRYKKVLGYQPAVMTSHDEGVFCVQEDYAEEVLAFAKECMRQPPAWAPDLPVAAKGDIAIRYGDAK